jgi:hypothetical protein
VGLGGYLKMIEKKVEKKAPGGLPGAESREESHQSANQRNPTPWCPACGIFQLPVRASGAESGESAIVPGSVPWSGRRGQASSVPSSVLLEKPFPLGGPAEKEREEYGLPGRPSLLPSIHNR